MIYGNTAGGFGMPKSLILEDPDGNEFNAVVVGEKVVFTATDNDVREGLVYASENGVSTGTKDIPAYHTTTGVQFIPANADFQIVLSDGDLYDYTELQAMTMPYNSSVENSMAVDRAIIQDNVYNVGSNVVISTITKDTNNKAIVFGIANGAEPAIIRFFMYKEEL